LKKKTDNWANQLQKYFFKKGINIYNLGNSADTTGTLLKKFHRECLMHRPQIIIFAVGTNDSQYIKSIKSLQVNPDIFRKNLFALIKQSLEFTKKIVFMGISKVDESKTTPILWYINRSHTNKNIIEYTSIIKTACKENNLHFIEMYNLLDKNELEDGVHPNYKGHNKIFEKIKAFIETNNLL